MKRDIIAFIRIAKKDYQEKIYKTGQFFMNTSEYFREMAQKDNSGLVGDIHETSFPRNYVINASGLELRAFDESDDDCQALALGLNTCIFCFYAITPEMCKEKDGALYFSVPADTIKGIVGNDDPKLYEIVLFSNPIKLLNMLNDKIDSMNLYHKDGIVTYDDHLFDIDKSLMVTDINSFGTELCFHKCRKFSNQNEYRIVIVNDSNSARDDIIIGKLDTSEYRTFIVPSVDTDIIIRIS
ncbi:MAG: hypothetical protein K6C68_02885 [Ruminococcus sp.]|nr:hypothetical protein [Ruminococcus sp.]